jgi:hypothetical protein
MWGASSADGKLTGDLGNAIETAPIDGLRSDRLLAGKLWPGDFRLLQQNRPGADPCTAASRARSPIVHLWLLGNFSIVGTSPARNRQCASIAARVRLELSVISDMA